MTNSIIVALISFAGTLIGTFAGIITSARLTNYRISKLEEKVEKHNTVIERVYKLETEMEDSREDISVLFKRTNK